MKLHNSYWHIALIGASIGSIWISGFITFLIISSPYVYCVGKSQSDDTISFANETSSSCDNSNKHFPDKTVRGILPLALNVSLLLFFLIRKRVIHHRVCGTDKGPVYQSVGYPVISSHVHLIVGVTL